jgi:GNAT superfamily N-acetyltransferase
MELIELERYDQALNSEVRQRAEHVGYAGYTRHFVAREDGQEVAFVALDFCPKGDPLWLYDLHVPSDMRRNHVGTRVLLAVENIAKQHGYAAVNLHPKSLDKDLSDEQLLEWYERCGYRKVEGFRGLTVQKDLLKQAGRSVRLEG